MRHSLGLVDPRYMRRDGEKRLRFAFETDRRVSIERGERRTERRSSLFALMIGRCNATAVGVDGEGGLFLFHGAIEQRSTYFLNVTAN